jgi:hypothetical protein
MNLRRHSLPALTRLPAVAVFALALSSRGVAQIPDAPTVPVAPSLPDAAIVKAPMAPQSSQEIIEERPTQSHVWVAGHWRWQEGRYAWVAGRWELPPRANLVWVEPRWEQRANGYVLAGGYWQEAAAGGVGIAGGAGAAGVAGVARPSTPAPGAVAVATPPPEVVIVQAPPPPQREYILERPSVHHVWIGGHWGWHGGRHVWVGGRWDLPPRSNVVWVEPRWERRDRGYIFMDGYWQEATPVHGYTSVGVNIGGGGVSVGVREVVVMQAPPPPHRERRPAHGPPGHIWVGGYWAWHGGRHLWVAGHFERPPHARAVWVEPRWERRGGNYIFIEGLWR